MEQLVEFSQRISDLANRSKHAASYAQTEEATKTAVVLPFIKMLGFDPFNRLCCTKPLMSEVPLSPDGFIPRFL